MRNAESLFIPVSSFFSSSLITVCAGGQAVSATSIGGYDRVLSPLQKLTCQKTHAILNAIAVQPKTVTEPAVAN